MAEHAILGCAASAAEGNGCAGGALGAATSAVVTPFALAGIDPNGAVPDAGQTAAIAAIAMLAGGGVAGALGQNATSAATWAQNEALNNDLASLLHIQAAIGAAKDAFTTAGNALSGVWNGVVSLGEVVANIPNGGPFASPGDPGYISASALKLPYSPGDQVGLAAEFLTAALATKGVGQGTADAEAEAIATNTTRVAAVDSAIGSSSAGFANITNSGSRSLNLQGSGGMAGAQEYLNSLPVVPGSATTTANGAQVVTLIDGSKATLYPVSTSGSVPTIQIFRPNGSYSSTKIRF